MKPKIAILTTFSGSDSAFSLVNVVRVQINMLLNTGYDPTLIVTEKFNSTESFWNGTRFRLVKAGILEDAVEILVDKLRPVLAEADIVICHDLVFMAAYKSYGDAVRILAKELEYIAWLHWQHSRGDHAPIEPVARSWFCYPNKGDLAYVAAINSTDLAHVRYIPHPLDFDYLQWPELAIRIAEDTGYPFVDIAMIYPSRLDRQKQLDKLIRVFAGLKRAGRSICLLFADAMATGQRFKDYKRDLHVLAKEQGLTDQEYCFLSERYPEECNVGTPRAVVKALYEMANLFIQPSNAETSSLVAMEAALAGNLLVINADFPPIHHLYAKSLSLPFGSVLEDTKYYRNIKTSDGKEQKIEDPQQFWDDRARMTIIPALDTQLISSVKRQQLAERWPARVFSEYMEPLIQEVWNKPAIEIVPASFSDHRVDPDVTAIITTIDNLPMLQRQIPILLEECARIIVVNNGSLDGTADWLETLANQPRIMWLNRENKGAGPGRNAGLDMWDYSTLYTLMLDGGILPLRGGVAAMKDYLIRHPEVAVISPEVATCFVKDESQAAYIMPDTIPDNVCFPQSCLSSTAYALVRAEAWRAARFSEEGPFAEPGWGCDDNELAYHWYSLGIVHHDWAEVFGVKLLRRTSGSFDRLFKETGIWPNQFGSVYEKRNVLMAQNWRFYYDPNFHTYGNIEKSFVITGMEYPGIARAIKRLHDEHANVSHEIIVNDDSLSPETLDWLEAVALRQTFGDTTIDKDGNIIKRCAENETEWTGDIIRNKLPRGKEIIKVHP